MKKFYPAVRAVLAAVLVLTAAGRGRSCFAEYLYDAGIEECVSLPEEIPEICGDGETAGAGTDMAEAGTEDIEMSAEAGGEASSAYTGETLVPALRADAEDMNRIEGQGVDPGIDHEVDAVAEIRKIHPEDDGLLQMAAEESGKTAEAMADAAAALREGAILEENVEEAVENAGASDPSSDRQNGLSLEYEPAADRDSAMAYLSSFVLSKVRDGSGDFDETTDLNGNDSGGGNGVIRTYDDLTYIYSYSTALGDRCMYNTVRGTRLYLEYVLPFGDTQAEFNLEAMPWLKGDGEGGKPVITVLPDGAGQRLVGYRDLPDRYTEEGMAYDVPGAGTVNCVVKVKALSSGTEIRVESRAWLAKPDNSAAAEDDLTLAADVSGTDPAVRVSVGPYLRLSIEKSSLVTQVGHGIPDDAKLMRLSDGGETTLSGSSRVFYFCIQCGKKNGSIKGVDPLDGSRRIHVEVTPDYGVNKNAATDLAFYDVRTLSMVTEEGCVRGVFHSEDTKTPIDGMPEESFGEIPENSVSVKNRRIAFDIEGYSHTEPGEIISHGTVTFIQREDESDARDKPVYWASLESADLKATPLLTPGGEMTYPTDSLFRISNQTDPSGNWDSHMILCSEKGLNYPVSSSNMATDGAIGYGMNFNCYLSVSFFPSSESEFEKSRDYFILWDNRKVALRRGADSAVLTALDQGAAYRFLTKADGSCWSGNEEMLSIDFTSSSIYDTLRVWPDYERAESFLAGIHPGEEDVGRYICGVICEAHEIPDQKIGRQYYQRICLAMKVLPVPENIGTTAMFLQAARTYLRQVATSYSAEDGHGENPENPGRFKLRNWNLSPMTYDPTIWENGALLPSSLTADNTLHKGTTLYIMPYALNVAEQYEDESETKTFDLSKTEDIRIRIMPRFEGETDVRGASAELKIGDIRDDSGNVIAGNARLYAIRKDGKKILLEKDTSYLVSDFVPGGEGSFSYTEKNLADLYDGGTFYIRKAGDLSQYLDISSTSASTPVRMRSVESETAKWVFIRKGSGAYQIKNASTGYYLMDRTPEVIQSSNSASDKIPFRTWRLRENEDGSVTLFSGGSGNRISSFGSSVSMESRDASGQSFKLTPAEPPKEETGYYVTFSDLLSSKEMPVFLFEETLEKPMITGETTASHQTVIAGDALTEKASKVNGHLASVSLAFTEIMANTIRETVDKASVMPGEELTYTIVYSNQYDSDHVVDLTDILPKNADDGLEDVSPHSDDADVKDDLSTHIAGTAVPVYVKDSVTASADKGSAVSADFEEDRLRIRGTLKSGETLTVTYKVSTKGLGNGDVIRNSCMQDDPFGRIWSNRVETVIGHDPRYDVHLTLMTGGFGTNSLYSLSVLAVCAAVILLVRRKRLLHGNE